MTVFTTLQRVVASSREFQVEPQMMDPWFDFGFSARTGLKKKLARVWKRGAIFTCFRGGEGRQEVRRTTAVCFLYDDGNVEDVGTH